MTIKFNGRAEPAQRLTSTQELGVLYMGVTTADGFLSVSFLTKDHLPMRVINFALNDIKEYSCDSIINDNSEVEHRTTTFASLNGKPVKGIL